MCVPFSAMCASPAIVVDMQTAAVAWLRTARCRMPLPRRGVSSSHSATECPRAAGPAPLGTCTRLSPAVLARRAFVPSHRPEACSVVRDSVPIRFGGRWAAGGRLRDDISGGGWGCQQEQEPLHGTAPPPRRCRRGPGSAQIGITSHRGVTGGVCRVRAKSS